MFVTFKKLEAKGCCYTNSSVAFLKYTILYVGNATFLQGTVLNRLCCFVDSAWEVSGDKLDNFPMSHAILRTFKVFPFVIYCYVLKFIIQDLKQTQKRKLGPLK